MNMELCEIWKMDVPFKYDYLFLGLQMDVLRNVNLAFPDNFLF